MFELINHPIKIMQIVATGENHGEDVVPAYNWKCVTVCENDILTEFHPSLRTFLFKRDDRPDLAAQADEGILTELRMPNLKSFKWDWQAVGYEAHIQWGLAADIWVKDCGLSVFKFTPQSTGGMVRIEFKLKSKLAEGDVGKLCELVKREVAISLYPPSEEQQQEKLA